MKTSKELLKLVRTVGRLPREDQHKILKIVELLTLAPSHIQRRTQGMLRDLVESDPATKSQCLAALDDVIEYLEYNVDLDEAYANGERNGHSDLLGSYYAFDLNGREYDA